MSPNDWKLQEKKTNHESSFLIRLALLGCRIGMLLHLSELHRVIELLVVVRWGHLLHLDWHWTLRCPELVSRDVCVLCIRLWMSDRAHGLNRIRRIHLRYLSRERNRRRRMLHSHMQWVTMDHILRHHSGCSRRLNIKVWVSDWKKTSNVTYQVMCGHERSKLVSYSFLNALKYLRHIHSHPVQRLNFVLEGLNLSIGFL